MTFLQPQFLYLLVAAPLAALAMLYALWARRRAVARFYGPGAGRTWAPVPPRFRGVLAAVCWSLAVALIALAIARPAHSPVSRKVERTGRDVVFVIDVSRSMLAQDLRPSRLERAKLMVGDVLDSAQGDRVGIVAFAGTPVVRCPMTTDYSFARMSLEAISTDSVGRGGTAIGDALRSALALIRAGQEDQTLAADIYLLTDGEDHETKPLEAAAEAAQFGVRLITIGLGSDVGAPVPVDPEQAQTARAQPRDGYVQYGGERVQSRMNPAALRSMAEATPGGAFLNVGVGNLELDRVYRLLRRDGHMKQLEATESVRYTEAFQLPLAAAILLGVIAMLIERVHLRLRRPAAPGLSVAAAVIALAFSTLSVRAQTVDDELRDTHRLLQDGKPGEALSLLDGATVRHPDSAKIAAARGAAQLAVQQTAEAEASFRRAEQLALGQDPATVARARFNLGLMDASRAAAQAREDPKAAITTLEQAERWFRNSRPGLKSDERAAAASNIESIQLAREALRKQIAEQEAKETPQESPPQSNTGQPGEGQSGDGKSGRPSGSPGDQQQEQKPQTPPEQKSAEDLANLARQQEEAAKGSQQAQQQQGQTPDQKREQADKLAQEQRKLSEQAEKLDEQLRQQQAQAKASESAQQNSAPQPENKPSDNLARSRDKLDEARQAQARAEEQLRQGDTSAAEQAQREAAEKLKDAARAALGLDQHAAEGEQESQPQEQQAGEQQGDQGQRAFNATAANILDREAKQRDAIRRFLKSQQRTRTPPVEKDW